MPGPAPKPESQRRRRNTPASYGAAKPATAPAAVPQRRTLGIDNPHQLVESMWTVVQTEAPRPASTPRPKLGESAPGAVVR